MPSISSYQYRELRRVDLPAFHEDIRRSPLYEFDVTMPADDYVDLYDGEMQRLVDIHAPLTTRTRRFGRHDCRWQSAVARDTKRRCWRLERRFRETCSSADRAAFRAAHKVSRNAITQSQSDAIRQRLSDVTDNPGATWKVVRDVLHRNTRPVCSDSQCQTLASGFSQLFVDKLSRIHQSIVASLASTTAPVNHADRRHSGSTLTQLPPTSPDEVLKLLKSSRLKPSPVDVLPYSLLRLSAGMLSPLIAHMGPLTSTADVPGRRALRSAGTNQLVVPPVRLSTVGSRAFPVAAAQIWNSLPKHVVSGPKFSLSGITLKRFYYKQSFCL